jgi:hypothetical protein
LEQTSDSVATLATRETDYLSFVARQTSAIYSQVYVARPQKILKTLKKRKLSSGEPIVIEVYEKPPSVFIRELLHRLLKEGAVDEGKTKDEADDADSEDAPAQATDIIEKIMVALDRMIQKRYKLYADEFVGSIKVTMQEFLDEIKELAPTEVELTEDTQAARSRLADIVDEISQGCEQLQALVPGLE